MARKIIKSVGRSKGCSFCQEAVSPDYKDVVRLRRFLSERGKIVSAQKTGVCTRHQRHLTVAIKRARFLALLPYTTHI